MAQKELIDYINMFREIAERNKLIVFVGSGVSCNVEGMPSWKDLILKMAKCVGYTKCENCEYKSEDCQLTCKFRFDFTPDEYLKIPQYLYNFDEELYKTILKNAISSNPIDAPMSAAIFNINPKHIITTNYDRLLETSKNFFRNQYEIIIKDADLLFAQKDKYIIKMHGDILDLDTIVLKEDDYLFYSQKHNLIETFVKSLLVDHTILFLGYSLADYNIKLILSWINYMRSQSKALDSHKIGYIVLDDVNIAPIKVSYFDNNNIGVINIKDMPVMSKIPESITDIRGKRLYNFLNCISDYSVLENTFGQWFSVSNIERLLDHEFIESNILLHEIGIHSCQIMDGTLNIYKEDDYNKIIFLLTYDNLKSQRIKSLLINSGIFRVVFSKVFSSQTLQLGSYTDMTIFNDEMYKLYISNNYDEIAATLSKNVTCGMIKQYFYQCIISGYSSFVDKYEHIEYGKLNEDEQIAFMFNSDFLYSLRTLNFNTHKTEMFINNISFKRERDLYATYLDILSNDNEIHFLNNQLEKVKELYYHKSVANVGLPTFNNVVKMRSSVLSRYFFYFYNHVFFQRFYKCS